MKAHAMMPNAPDEYPNASLPSTPATHTVRILRQGQPIHLHDVACDRTLLQVLREDLSDVSVKEGCGEGDCGACTVTLGELGEDGQIHYKAINSCIRLASSVDGMAVWTAADLSPETQSVIKKDSETGFPALTGTSPKDLHPVQQAFVDHHASQCGFCTPGFVMSLFAAYQTQVLGQGAALTASDAEHVLSGNLCRCTGYRSIVDAATHMHQNQLQIVDEAALTQQLQALQASTNEAYAEISSKTPPQVAHATNPAPTTLRALLQARSQYPDAQVIAGCTDVGLWVTKLHKRFSRTLDVTRVAELSRITQDDSHIHIGAAATLTDAFAALVQDRPQLASFAHRFAGLPVRNSGTLGGNVANGSPIGDSMPLLIALGATITLQRWDGVSLQARNLALETFYTAYRQNLLQKDELLTHIHVHKATPDEFCRVYKVSKRMEDDISAVCLALCMTRQDGVVKALRIGAGGVAATPARATASEAMAIGQAWTEATAMQLAKTLQAEFKPIDDMRATGRYRSDLLHNLVKRFWNESQGHSATSLESIAITVQEAA